MGLLPASLLESALPTQQEILTQGEKENIKKAELDQSVLNQHLNKIAQQRATRIANFKVFGAKADTVMKIANDTAKVAPEAAKQIWDEFQSKDQEFVENGEVIGMPQLKGGPLINGLPSVELDIRGINEDNIDFISQVSGVAKNLLEQVPEGPVSLAVSEKGVIIKKLKTEPRSLTGFFTVPQESAINKQLDKLESGPLFISTSSAISNASHIRKILSSKNPIGDNFILRLMVKLSGDVGNIRLEELKDFKSSRAIKARLATIGTEWKKGLLTDESRKYLLDLVTLVESESTLKQRSLIKRSKDRLLAFKIPGGKDLDAIFDTVANRNFFNNIELLTGMNLPFEAKVVFKGKEMTIEEVYEENLRHFTTKAEADAAKMTRGTFYIVNDELFHIRSTEEQLNPTEKEVSDFSNRLSKALGVFVELTTPIKTEE